MASPATVTPPEPKPTAAKPTPKPRAGRGALLVAAGIFTSKIVGLVREKVYAHYLGTGVASAALRAGLRIPNFLQNLFGEGVLSASFIPVYANLLGKNEEEAADEVASTVFGLLCLAVAVLVGVGTFGAPYLVDLIAGGFTGEARELTVRLVRILFPGIGLLVLSAWCLGVLNSHRRFFLSYAAPVGYSVVFIAALLLFGPRRAQEDVAVAVAWGATAGCAVQFLVQLPTVLSLMGKFRPAISLRNPLVRQVLHAFAPVVLARGVVQVSALVDTYYASEISPGVFASIGFAQVISMLPISLFGMSVSAAELPEMAREQGSSTEVAAALQRRLSTALERVAFFVVPSAAAFLFVGDVVAGTLYQGGHFTPADTRFLWYLLIGSSFGLLASTFGRLYSSAFYALKNTRTPLYFATVRVLLTAALAWYCVFRLPGDLGVARELGGVALLATYGMAAWLEFFLLRRAMTQRIGVTGVPLKRLATLWGAAIVSAGLAVGLKLALVAWKGPDARVFSALGGHLLPPPALPAVPVGVLVLGVFGVAYFAITALLGVPQAQAIFAKVLRRRAAK